MRKECEDVRILMQRALRGHVFRSQERRIAAHVSECVFCRTELDALRRAEETRVILREIDPEGGAPGIVSRLSWVTRLLFRPLWLAAVLAVAAAVYLFAIRPLLHDADLERLDAAAPVPPRAAAPALSSLPLSTRIAAAQGDAAPRVSAAAPSVDPLIVIIALDQEGEKMGIRRINEAMKEHALLKTMRLSESVREISGNLTAGELATFFARIQDAGKITYKRSRLASVDSSAMLPFIVRISIVPSPVRPVPEPAAIKPEEHRGERPGESAADRPADGPAVNPAGRQEEAPAPAPPPAR